MMSREKFAQAEDEEGGRASREAEDAGASYTTVANVCFVGGGILVLGGAGWLVLGGRSSDPEVGVALGPRGILAKGKFGSCERWLKLS